MCVIQENFRSIVVFVNFLVVGPNEQPGRPYFQEVPVQIEYVNFVSLFLGLLEKDGSS